MKSTINKTTTLTLTLDYNEIEYLQRLTGCLTEEAIRNGLSAAYGLNDGPLVNKIVNFYKDLLCVSRAV